MNCGEKIQEKRFFDSLFASEPVNGVILLVRSNLRVKSVILFGTSFAYGFGKPYYYAICDAELWIKNTGSVDRKYGTVEIKYAKAGRDNTYFS